MKFPVQQSILSFAPLFLPPLLLFYGVQQQSMSCLGHEQNIVLHEQGSVQLWHPPSSSSAPNSNINQQTPRVHIYPIYSFDIFKQVSGL